MQHNYFEMHRVVPRIHNSLLFLAQWCSMVWEYHHVFIHSLVERHLIVSCLGLLQIQLLWTSVRVLAFVRVYAFLSSGCRLRVGMAGSYDMIKRQPFKKLPDWFPKWLCHVPFPPTVFWLLHTLASPWGGHS